MDTDRPLRVLIPIRWRKPAGVFEVSVLSLLPYLAEQFEVAVAVQYEDEDRLAGLAVPDEVDLYELPQRATWRELVMVLDDFVPDVVHAPEGWSRLEWSARRRGAAVLALDRATGSPEVIARRFALDYAEHTKKRPARAFWAAD